MTDQTLDYAMFIDHAMRDAVREILRQVERTGLPGQHHFFISYRADAAGVEMSEALRAKYPKEITIVLQHQFWDLKVEQDKFFVSLSFSNIPEKLAIPFSSLTGFADPSTKFGLKFHYAEAEEVSENGVYPDVSQETALLDEGAEQKESSKVIALDAFRKK